MDIHSRIARLQQEVIFRNNINWVLILKYVSNGMVGYISTKTHKNGNKVDKFYCWPRSYKNHPVYHSIVMRILELWLSIRIVEV